MYSEDQAAEILGNTTTSSTSNITTSTSQVYVMIPVYESIFFPNSTMNTTSVNVTLVPSGDVEQKTNGSLSYCGQQSITAVVIDGQSISFPIPADCPPTTWRVQYTFDDGIHYLDQPFRTITVFDDTLFAVMQATVNSSLAEQLALGIQYLNLSASYNDSTMFTGSAANISAFANYTVLEKLVTQLVNGSDRAKVLTEAFSELDYLLKDTTSVYKRASQQGLASSLPTADDDPSYFYGYMPPPPVENGQNRSNSSSSNGSRRLYSGSSNDYFCVMSDYTDVADQMATWTTRLEIVNEVVKATTDKWGYVFDAAGYGDNVKVQSALFFKDLVNLLADIPKGLQELYIQLAAKNLVTYTTIGVMIGGFNEIADIALDMYKQRCLVECLVDQPFDDLAPYSVGSSGTRYTWQFTYDVPATLKIFVDEFSLDPKGCFAQQQPYITKQVNKFLGYREFLTFFQSDKLVKLRATMASMSKGVTPAQNSRVLTTEDVESIALNPGCYYNRNFQTTSNDGSIILSCRPSAMIYDTRRGTVTNRGIVQYKLRSFLPARKRQLSYRVTVDYPRCITELAFAMSSQYYATPFGWCCGNMNFGYFGYSAQPELCRANLGSSSNFVHGPGTYGCVTIYDTKVAQRFVCWGRLTYHTVTAVSIGNSESYDIWICEC